ncbi:MAG: sigma factor-like helix-turn-helix DNA-binding protein [Rhizobium sp.]|nr:sigma factor-like helix-turn-helix DNA-binding protein [Rhizobium sp.]
MSDREFSTLEVTVRLNNVFTAKGISKVADLSRFTISELLSTQNFGRKSANDLLKCLQEGLDQGPPQLLPEGGSDTGGHTASRTLIEAIHESLSRLPERAAQIINRRMGLSEPPQTLQQVGDYLGVTRERVRQIEAKALERLLRDEIWDNVLAQKISSLLQDRNTPLPLRGVDAADPWFFGIGEKGEALNYLLDNVSTKAKILEVMSVEYLGFLSQNEWEQALTRARNFLDASVERKVTVDQCRAAVSAELPVAAREFSELLWECATKNSHFADQGGDTYLVGQGRGADHVVIAILASSDRPLHYTEIAQIALNRTGKPYMT